jgi:hypothetical protein
MHYEIDYATMDEDMRKAAAMSDVKGFLGTDRFQKMTENLRGVSRPTQEFWTDSCAMLTGIQGYPARWWYEHIWGVAWVPEAPHGRPMIIGGCDEPASA